METITSITRALSDSNRLRVLSALSIYPELYACQLLEMLEISGATLSRHMNILRLAGLVRSRKRGKWVYYALRTDNPTAAPIMQWTLSLAAKSPIWAKDRQTLVKIMRCNSEEPCIQPAEPSLPLSAE